MIKQTQPKFFEGAAQFSAMKRHGTPEEVANAAVFLTSSAASYITDANLRVDGGALKNVNF